MKHLLILTLPLALGIAAQAETLWRTFTSADSQRTFEGRLTGYNASTQTVSVQNRQGKTIYLKEDLISQDDREYVQDNVDKLPPDIRLDVRFERLAERGETTRSGATRTTTSNAGYKISLKNYKPNDFTDVEIEYLLIYRKDQIGSSGTNELVRGSTSFSLEANGTQEVKTETVSLKTVVKRGSSSSSGASGGGCRSCPGAGAGGGTTVTRSQRSRDYLVGCVAHVKVNGQVVETTATAVNLLRQYEAELESGSSSDS